MNQFRWYSALSQSIYRKCWWQQQLGVLNNRRCQSCSQQKKFKSESSPSDHLWSFLFFTEPKMFESVWLVKICRRKQLCALKVFVLKWRWTLVVTDISTVLHFSPQCSLTTQTMHDMHRYITFRNLSSYSAEMSSWSNWLWEQKQAEDKITSQVCQVWRLLRDSWLKL